MYKETLRQVWAEIDMSAFDHNVKEIKRQMGSASRATCDKWTVSWGMQRSGALDREAMKLDYPGIDFTKYQKETRVFRISEKRSRS